MLLFGDSSTGKSVTALRFPSPCVIDLENSTRRYRDAFDFDVLPPCEVGELPGVIDWLSKGDHDYKTLVIDPITLFCDAVVDMHAQWFLNRRKSTHAGHHGEFYDLQPGDYRVIKSWLKRFIRRLHVLDMNVICVAREKPRYAKGKVMQEDGVTFDGDRSLSYEFDYVIRLYRPEPGREFKAETLKEREIDESRKLPVRFLLDDNFSRPPKVLMDRFEAEIFRPVEKREFITDDQSIEIESLINGLMMKPRVVKKSLARYGAQHLTELTREQADEIIDKLTEKAMPFGGAPPEKEGAEDNGRSDKEQEEDEETF